MFHYFLCIQYDCWIHVQLCEKMPNCLCAHQQCVEIFAAQHPWQHLLDFLFLAIWTALLTLFHCGFNLHFSLACCYSCVHVFISRPLPPGVHLSNPSAHFPTKLPSRWFIRCVEIFNTQAFTCHYAPSTSFLSECEFSVSAGTSSRTNEHRAVTYLWNCSFTGVLVNPCFCRRDFICFQVCKTLCSRAWSFSLSALYSRFVSLWKELQSESGLLG